MLVLSRKFGEEVVIGDNIRVRVVGIRGKQVRLGITAPADVNIYRAELCRPGDDFGSLARNPATSEVQP
jgi:carbon storage regulator